MPTDRPFLRRAAALSVLPVTFASLAVAAAPAAAAPRPTLCADAGVTLRGTEQADTLRGTDGDDVILGLGGGDVIEGLGGNDVICGGNGSDRIDAGPGDDVVTQGDFVVAAPADPAVLDIVALGDGNDAFFGSRDGSSFVDGGNGADWITGSPAFDLLAGGPGDDDMTNPSAGDSAPLGMTFGGDGNDRIRGGAGRDYVDGGAGDDTIVGALDLGGSTGPSAPYEAEASSSLLRADVPFVMSSPLPPMNLDLASTTAVADSDGDVAGDEPGAQRTGAIATSTLSSPYGPVDISANVATAPTSESNEDILLPIDFQPLVTLDLVNTSAMANWISDTECASASVPLSSASHSVPDLRVADLGDGRSLVAVTADPTDGADRVEAATALPVSGAPGDGRVVQASTTTDLNDVSILRGFGDPSGSIDVTVLQDPAYTVTASGLAGGAAVVGTDAVVEVTVTGSPPIVLVGGQDPVVVPLLSVTLGDLLGAVSPLVDGLSLVARLSAPVTKVAAPDGSSASVDAQLLRVEILPPSLDGLLAPVRDLVETLFAALGLSTTAPFATVELAPMAASVSAPAGGLTCAGSEPGDLLLGGDGADTIQGGSGADFVLAGAGDDLVRASGAGDLVVGDAGNDTLHGDDGGDVLFGGADADALDGGAGVDWCDGGDGDDAADVACELPEPAGP